MKVEQAKQIASNAIVQLRHALEVGHRILLSRLPRNHFENIGRRRNRGQKATFRSDMSSVSLVFCWPIWAKWFRIRGRCVMRLSPLRWTGEKAAKTGRSTRIERLPSNKEGKTSKCIAERRLQVLSSEISPSVVRKLYRILR
jgi:hypothetical protein